MKIVAMMLAAWLALALSLLAAERDDLTAAREKQLNDLFGRRKEFVAQVDARQEVIRGKQAQYQEQRPLRLDWE